MSSIDFELDIARRWHGRPHPMSGLMGLMRTSAWRPAALTPFAARLRGPVPAATPHRQSEVRLVCDRRAQAVQMEEARLGAPLGPVAGGRLLGYRPDDTLSDGAAAVASHDFFDVDNEPPWDVWLRYDVEQHMLVAWAPPEFVQAADDGISTNPEECIFWI